MTTGSTPLATENAHHSRSGNRPPALTSSLIPATGVMEVTALLGEVTRERDRPAAFLTAASMPSPSCGGLRGARWLVA